MNKDMENTFNQMAELGGSEERLGRNTGPVINAPLRHKIPKPCGGCGATSERERCIGCLHDFGTQESAWVFTRPAPAATDTGLQTVKRELLEAVKFFDDFPPSIQRMTNIRVVEAAHKYIEQAEELLATERAHSISLAHDLAVANQRIRDLEADNAAKDARIKKLARFVVQKDNQIKELRASLNTAQKTAEVLEAKLAAAEAENTRLRNEQSAIAKALAYEPPYQASLAKRAEQLLSHVEHLDGKLTATGRLLTIWDELPDNTSSAGLMAAWFIKAGTIVREARAVLGGKP